MPTSESTEGPTLPGSPSTAGYQSGTFEQQASKSTSFAFRDQFFVPLIKGGEARGLMVLSLAVDIPDDQRQFFLQNELRLRDAFLRRLLAYANSGGFDGNFTSLDRLGLLHGELLDTAKQMVGDAVTDVLIIEIAQQGRG